MTNKAELRNKMAEIYDLEPNDLRIRPLTRVFKMTTGRLKKMPFLYVVPLAFILAAILYLLFGQMLINLVSLLQYGS